MAYTLGNKCAKNCCKRAILVQLIVENVVTCFLRHSIEPTLFAVFRIVQIKEMKFTKSLKLKFTDDDAS